MYKIVRKEVLNTSVVLMEIEAPFVARKAQPGQFVILRVDEDGERIPLTISDFDREKGIITIIFRAVGATTLKLSQKNEGEYIEDFAGPLGVPTKIDGLKKEIERLNAKLNATEPLKTLEKKVIKKAEVSPEVDYGASVI